VLLFAHMKRSSSRTLVGLILLVAGAALFVYGIVVYNAEQSSLNLNRVLTGSSPKQQEAVVEMIGGGAVSVIGLLLVALRRGGARRR
jgi:hypothetical protein